MEAFLNPRKYLGIMLENIDNLRVRLLEEADRSRHDLSPFCKSSAMVRRPKKNDTPGAIKNFVQVLLRSLSRLK